ncbi:putative ribosomal protein S12e [Rosa chinensis]|uniref:Putative ribosomal protein S12e n=1 Tax=Rosa chinensis TaxID=74649 RepID=A0A2P6P295_ROSCH|nr:putative ribosomal protein S12e [Rosa chinensis]
MSLQGGPHFKNFVDLLRDLLAMALANGLLRRGLPTASNLIPDQKVWLCVFAEDSNQDDFVKAVKSLCEGYHVEYLTIASAKTLGQWSVSQFGDKDSEGKAKRVLCLWWIWGQIHPKFDDLSDTFNCLGFSFLP